jgi:hypothetical protein
MEELLNNDYRKLVWEKSKELILKISSVINIDKVIVLGSFTTTKERPADVDFIVMIKTKDTDEDWSTDIQFVPSNNFGQQTIDDAEIWMKEKYGEGNYKTFEFDIEEYKNK